MKWTVTALLAAALVPAGFGLWKQLERRAEQGTVFAAKAEPTPPTARQDVTAPPAAVQTPPRDPPRPAAPAVSTTSMPDTETRWTNTWANVRQGRGTDTPVVQILEPGQQIEVADQQNSWWVAYVDGHAVGYVANSLLDREPPNP